MNEREREKDAVKCNQILFFFIYFRFVSRLRSMYRVRWALIGVSCVTQSRMVMSFGHPFLLSLCSRLSISLFIFVSILFCHSGPQMKRFTILFHFIFHITYPVFFSVFCSAIAEIYLVSFVSIKLVRGRTRVRWHTCTRGDSNRGRSNVKRNENGTNRTEREKKANTLSIIFLVKSLSLPAFMLLPE